MAPEYRASVPLGHFYTEFSSPSLTPNPQHTTKACCLQLVTGHHTGQTLPPSESESPLFTRDNQAPGVLERQRAGVVLGLDSETIKPIHQAEITGQLKQAARGNLLPP